MCHSMMTATVLAVFAPASAFQRTADGAFGSVALTEEEYQQVARLKDDDAMGDFIQRLVASKGQNITSFSELGGLAPWYSGTRDVQSLSALEEDLATRWWLVSEESEAEYQQVAALRDDAAMAQFIARLVADKGHRITSLSELNGLAPWYSGTRGAQSLSALQDDLATKWWVVPAFALEPKQNPQGEPKIGLEAGPQTDIEGSPDRAVDTAAEGEESLLNLGFGRLAVNVFDNDTAMQEQAEHDEDDAIKDAVQDAPADESPSEQVASLIGVKDRENAQPDHFPGTVKAGVHGAGGVTELGLLEQRKQTNYIAMNIVHPADSLFRRHWHHSNMLLEQQKPEKNLAM